ncbi:MAG: AAA family ATPase [Deltaproteobacteria bacterium]|nr:AAA family ATPase [Deltaproteobacteria bacterium]
MTHVFSSDPQGAAALATALGAAHVVVDAGREVFPIHGREVRADLWRKFACIVPQARPFCALTIGVIGPESCGKSTLVSELAAHFDATVIDDAIRRVARGGIPSSTDFLTVGREAPRHRRAALERTETGIVIADTTVLGTRAWMQRLGMSSWDRLTAGVRDERLDLWLLCHDDLASVCPPEHVDPSTSAPHFPRMLTWSRSKATVRLA